MENSMKKQNEKIEMFENKSKDTDLKIVEQNKEIDILKKKLRILKEKDSKVIDLEKKLNELIKKVDMFTEKANETDGESQLLNQMPSEVDNKCSKCDFVAKNEQGLKVHTKAKHTEPEKFKCFTCDFSCTTKTELTTHNDIYWNSHRMTFYPEKKKKKYYLDEIEQMKADGFTVNDSFYNKVLKIED